jgi:cyclic-di-GMP-binding protein
MARPGPTTAPHLASLEKVNAWLSTLPVDNPASCRIQIAKGLHKLANSYEAPTVDGLNGLLRLDEGCHPILTDILRHELEENGESVRGREEVREEMEEIYSWLGETYARFVVGYHETRTSVTPIAQLMALAIARGLHALANQAKWAYFAQEVPSNCWERLHTLYEYAELDGIDTRPVTLYARPHEIQASCAGLYARAALLSTLNSGVFSAKQIETADHWLLSWTASLPLYNNYRADEHFHATLLRSNKPAFRVQEQEESPYARYLATSNLAIEIERARTRLEEGAVQRDMGFISTQPLAEAKELLVRLQKLWAPERVRLDQRQERRVLVESEAISVVRGLSGICESARQDYERAHGLLDLNRGLTREEELDLQVYGFVTERTRSKLRSRPLDATQAIAALEGWTLRDESVVGYGTSFPTGTYPDPKMGTLVGAKRRKTERWIVGSVVRVRAARGSGETLVGIEILSLSPVIVTLAEDKPGVAAQTSQLSWGLFLPGDKTRGHRDSLLIDSALYGLGRPMIMGARNVRYSVRQGSVLRTGERWHRIQIEVLGRRE